MLLRACAMTPVYGVPSWSGGGPTLLRIRTWVLVASALSIATDTSAQSGPVPHTLGPPVATSTRTFRAVSPSVSLGNGRLLVLDPSAHVMVVLDSSLKTTTVVLDSVSGRSNSYVAGSFIIKFRGDSALLYDGGAKAFVVVDPDGRLGRVLAGPPPDPDGRPVSLWMARASSGSLPFVSPSLGFVYQQHAKAPQPAKPLPGQPDIRIRREDSLLVLRMSFETHRIDAITKIDEGTPSSIVLSASPLPPSPYDPRDPGGRLLYPFYDDAVVTADGSIAVFHAHEYRFDWINPDGTRSQSPKVPYPWQPVSEQLRQQLVDSINAAHTNAYQARLEARAADSIRTGSPPMVDSLINIAGTRALKRVVSAAPKPPEPILPEDVPDFFPPTVRLGIMPDADNHVWVHRRDAGTDAIWDVVDRRGELVDRVRVPADQRVMGFAAGGVVYVAISDAGVLRIEEHHVR
jgi:hypothetical protein